MSPPTCYNSTGAIAIGYTPCGWSDMLASALCCPDNFECRADGLCSLPSNATVTSSLGNTYGTDPSYRDEAIWVQVPGCTGMNWAECSFDPAGCYTERKATLTGFLPLNGCKPNLQPIQNGDWVSCTSSSTCQDSARAANVWNPIGAILCAPGRTNSTCPQLVPGDDTYDDPTDVDYSNLPVLIAVPILIFFLFATVGLTSWVVARRRRHLHAARNEGVATREEQELPSYEEHWRSRRLHPELPCESPTSVECGDPPPKYPELPERTLDQGRSLSSSS